MHQSLAVLAAVSLASLSVFAGEAHGQECPIARALAESDADVRAFDGDATTLARLGLTGGQAGGAQPLADAYVERALELAGLEPAFGSAGQARWRQVFSHGEARAQNIAGLLPGMGNLSGQYVVVGVGMEGNAAGVAAMLGMARSLVDAFESERGPRRGVLFIAFGGGRGGLDGADHYARNPIAPIPTHTLMLGLGSLGRIEGGRLRVLGVGSAVGLDEVLGGAFEASILTEELEPAVVGEGIHTAFYGVGVPVLMASRADADGAGGGDAAWEINRTHGAAAARVMARVVSDIALRAENLAFVGGQRPSAGPGMNDIRVRFGIRPGTYDEGVFGVPIGGITPNSPADFAGLQAGDVLVGWNGHDVGDVRDWMGQLARHEPGDVVTVTVLRDGKHLDLKVTLEGRGGV